MKLSEIISCNDSLVALKDNTSIPVGIGYIMALNVRMFQPYIEEYSKSQMELVEKYAEYNTDGTIKETNGRIKILDNKAYTEGISELLKQDCPLIPMKFKLSDIENSTIAPGHITNMLPIITDADTEDK